MRTTAIAFLAVSVASLPLAACGDSGRDEPAGPTRAEFIAKIDAQCKISNARTKTLNEEADRVAATTRGEADLLRKIAPILARAYGQVRDNAAALQAVNPPAADAATIERIRELYDEQAETVRKLGRAAKRGEIDPYKAHSQELKDVLVRLRRAARAYGFKECGSTKSDA